MPHFRAAQTYTYHTRMSAPLALAFAIAIASVTVGGSGNVMECNCGLLVSKCRSLLWKPSDVVQNNGAVVGNTMHAYMDLRLLVGVLRITVSISAQGYAVIKLLYKIVFFFFCSNKADILLPLLIASLIMNLWRFRKRGIARKTGVSTSMCCVKCKKLQLLSLKGSTKMCWKECV